MVYLNDLLLLGVLIKFLLTFKSKVNTAGKSSLKGQSTNSKNIKGEKLSNNMCVSMKARFEPLIQNASRKKKLCVSSGE